MSEQSKYIIPHEMVVKKETLLKLMYGEQTVNNKVVWFTGYSGSGKSTVANKVASYLVSNGFYAKNLDGDDMRNGLTKNLSFSLEDREENIRRTAYAAKLLYDVGYTVLASFISPQEHMRQFARSLFPENHFIEAFVDAPLDECKRRDTKGLYKLAEQGIIKDFTGVSPGADYEIPSNPELTLDTLNFSEDECARQVIDRLDLK